MKAKTAAIILTALLILSMGLAGAWARGAGYGVTGGDGNIPEEAHRDEAREKTGTGRPPIEEAVSSRTAHREEAEEKAREAIEEAEELIEEAEELIEEAEELGADVLMLKELLESAISALEDAEQLLSQNQAGRALSMAMYAKARAQMVIRAAEELIGTAEQAGEEVSAEELRELLEDLKLKLDELVSMAQELEAVSTALESLIEKAMKLLEKANELIDGDPEAASAILEKAEKLIEEIAYMLEDLVHAAMTTTKTSITETEETTVTVETEETETTATTTASATTPVTTVTTLEEVEVEAEAEVEVEVTYPAGEVEIEKETEINVEVTGGNGEVKVVVEQVEQKIKYENGTTLIIKEKIIVAGNRTIVTISKELVIEKGKTRPIDEITMEQNQSLIGAVLKIAGKTHELVKVDQALEVEILQVEKNRLRVRLEAPDGTPGRLFVLELAPEAIDLNNLLGFELTVNGEKAVLASSLLDLASGVYDEPAYVFIISAEGAQILLYIPHFSEYVVEITGIIQRAAEALVTAVQQVLSNPVLTFSTLTATIILLAAAVLSAAQRRMLRRI